MEFYEVFERVVDLLRHQRRVSYRALKRQFALDDDYLEDLKAELITAKRLAIDEQGAVLVWIGETPTTALAQSATRHLPSDTPAAAAERRQLTVLFCDLVDSTALARRLDPEDYRDVVRTYQATCGAVIQRFEGTVAQYLGDGLLVYFGYPQAHENDAQRAVQAGLEILDAIAPLTAQLVADKGLRLAVRLGIHTGLVVVGEVGGGGRQEQLALGDTPNIAARLQSLAAPDTVVVSEATWRLVQGYFACDDLGPQSLKGVETPVQVYRVLGTSGAQSRLDVLSPRGLTPLVGREAEIALLRERWTQAQDGLGQVVLLSGEAGIGKSRLVVALKEQVAAEPQAWLTPCQCSPYYQNSALYPMIDLLERVVLQFDREETPQQKYSKLEGFLVQHGLPLPEAVPLFAALLSLPLTADYTPLPLSPEQQKQKTMQALLTVLLRIAAQQPVLFVMEDLHWVDPSTLELLSLLVDQGPTTRILALLTFRPDFSPPWTGRSHFTQVTVHRLPRRQAVEVIRQVAHGKVLPPEVVEQIVAKTDGVPLFVEELTKMVLESDLLQEREDRYELAGPLPPLAIPATLHDSLMARLDRLGTVKGLAQLGATLGREFSYELLQAVSPWDEGTLQRGLHQLVEAEFLYQRGAPPQATYLFKHALIQDAAYQSLLRSTRQQYHQRIAQVVEARFPELCETQPELLAHHYTEASLIMQAMPYWQRAGQRAIERSANLEAVGHLTTGLEVLKTLPDTGERTQQELALLTTLGPAMIVIKGYGAPEVEDTYLRARELCQQVDDPAQLFPVVRGLWNRYLMRAEHQQARELGERLLSLAHSLHNPASLIEAHRVFGTVLWNRGELPLAYEHLEQGIALYKPHQHRTLAFRYGADPGVVCRFYAAVVLWSRGYPQQARRRMEEALTLAQEISHPHSLAFVLVFAAILHRLCGEVQAAYARADMATLLAAEQGIAQWFAGGTILRGWAVAAQGQAVEGVTQIYQGLAAWRAAWAEVLRPSWLALLAEAYAAGNNPAGGLHGLAEALVLVEATGERWYEAELYRLRGELLLQHAIAESGEAEVCF